MSTQGDNHVKSGIDQPKKARGFQTNVRMLVLVVASCGVILWAVRRLWENSDPVLVEARAIQKHAIGALRSGKPAERLTAIQELERLRRADPAIAIPPLVATLKDPAIDVRIAAAQALSSIGPAVVKSRADKEPVYASASALSECLNAPNPKFRVAAAEALGSIVSSLAQSGSGEAAVAESARALIDRLKDAEPGVRSATAIALGKIALPRLAPTAGSPASRDAILDALVGALGDRDAKVRLAAINAMASYPIRTDAPHALGLALKDESAENRGAAVRGLILRQQGLDPWVPILLRLVEHDPDPSVREQCMRTLSFAFKPPAVTPAALPALIAGLKSGDIKVRSQAASIVGGLKADARAAVPELLRVLNEPVDPTVVPVQGPSGTFDPGCAAAHALGQIAPGCDDFEKGDRRLDRSGQERTYFPARLGGRCSRRIRAGCRGSRSRSHSAPQ